jgi:hypothetical protein
MGLDARIPCNCYPKGLTKPFPLPELESHFKIGDEYGYWGLDLGDEYREAHRTVLRWENDACEHSLMTFFITTVARWGEIDEYLWAYDQVGWQHFPTFKQELRFMTPGGSWSTSSCAKILEEITFFEKQTNLGVMNCLVDTQTDIIHHWRVIGAGNHSILMMGKVYYGFDENGFFIVDPERKVEVFRSRYFEMRLQSLTPPSDNFPGLFRPVEYVALDRRQAFKSDFPIINDFFIRDANQNWRLRRKFIPVKIEKRPLHASQFQWITDNLKAVCQASIEVGNPLFWVD